MTPSEKDFANPEIAAYLEKYLRGKDITARDRVQLFKLAWDMIGEQFGSRQLQYEWFYSGDPYFTRQRFYRSPMVKEYKDIVTRLLKAPLNSAAASTFAIRARPARRSLPATRPNTEPDIRPVPPG